MNEICSIAGPVAAGTATAREESRSLLRWITLGAAVLALSVLAMLHGTSVGAASPYPPNTLVSTYFDPRYCDGSVSIVSDASSNLIDICTTTGQRIYPVYPDYGYPAGYVAGNYINGYVNNGYINNGFVNGGYANAYINNGYINPYVNNGAYFNGAYTNGLYGNGIFNNGNTFPAGATFVGGVAYYNDNRFCGDGKIAFVPGQGYFCQNGGPLVPNGVNTVNCSNFFYNGCGTYRFLEVSSSTTQPAATTGTTAVTAAPAAPVAATTQTPTALNASQTQATAANAGGSGVKILSVQSATTPAVAQNDGRDDSR